MKPKQLVIIGGGSSINKGVDKGLWAALRGCFAIGINYSYRYFDSTCLACVNYSDFYDTNRKELAKLPLIITPNRLHPSKWEKNTMLINKNFMLSGILALKVGIDILKEGEIFLLGYDYSAINKETHFYQGDINHRGIGRDEYYNRGFEDRDFKSFTVNNKVKIYNVSMHSRIKCFSKLSYHKFFKKLNNITYNQEELVKEIQRKL